MSLSYIRVASLLLVLITVANARSVYNSRYVPQQEPEKSSSCSEDELQTNTEVESMTQPEKLMSSIIDNEASALPVTKTIGSDNDCASNVNGTNAMAGNTAGVAVSKYNGVRYSSRMPTNVANNQVAQQSLSESSQQTSRNALANTSRYPRSRSSRRTNRSNRSVSKTRQTSTQRRPVMYGRKAKTANRGVKSGRNMYPQRRSKNSSVYRSTDRPETKAIRYAATKNEAAVRQTRPAVAKKLQPVMVFSKLRRIRTATPECSDESPAPVSERDSSSSSVQQIAAVEPEQTNEVTASSSFSSASLSTPVTATNAPTETVAESSVFSTEEISVSTMEQSSPMEAKPPSLNVLRVAPTRMRQRE